MAQWIEVKVRYDKMTETGKSVNYPYQAQLPAQSERSAKEIAGKLSADKGVQRTMKKFSDAVPEGTKVFVSA